MKIFYITTSTPAGPFHMLMERTITTQSKTMDIVRVSGFDKIAALQLRLPQTLQTIPLKKADTNHPYQKAIAAYFKGNPKALASIQCSQTGTVFQEKVWQAISAIPYGQTTSYKTIAKTAGNAKAIQAVGTACGKNNLALLIPCHRVIKTDGTLGGFYYDLSIKVALLKNEGIIITE